MPKIVFAEDNGQVRSMLVKTVIGLASGMETTEAQNGDEALAIIHDRKPDLLVTDINMGSRAMDGLTLIETLQRKELLTFPVIIFATPVDEQMDKVMEMMMEHEGLIFFVMKGGMDRLKAKIREVLHLAD